MCSPTDLAGVLVPKRALLTDAAGAAAAAAAAAAAVQRGEGCPHPTPSGRLRGGEKDRRVAQGTTSDTESQGTQRLFILPWEAFTLHRTTAAWTTAGDRKDQRS